MPQISVLYIEDAVVGPHLELIRNVCEPESRSRPHITVRYFDRLKIPKAYANAAIRYIDLVEPGSFGLGHSPRQQKSYTIYIRCESDDLLHLEHKPHYPSSEFHITLYDGDSPRFASALLRILQTSRWNFRIHFPLSIRLTQIELNAQQTDRAQLRREYRPLLKQLFYDATSEHLTWDYLVSLSMATRLRTVRALCQRLEVATTDYEAIRRKTPSKEEPRQRVQGSDDIYPAIHLTPPELACAIAEYAVGLLTNDEFPVAFGDPAVGAGAFYSALLQVLPTAQIASAMGIDVSAAQVTAARRRWSHRGMDVILGDYLHMDRISSPRTLILANPPYLRHQDIPAKYKQELRERASVTLGLPVSGLSGQYVYFLLLSHSWMAPGALAAWLIPSEFMRTAYGAAVRHYLTRWVELIRVHQFGSTDPQFERAKVLPSVVVFRNRKPPAEHTALLTSGGTLEDPSITQVILVRELRHERKWFIPMRDRLATRPAGLRIGDLFSVHRGIATGANDFFILERHEAARLGIPKCALRPVLPKARTLERDIIEREVDGYPKLSPQLCVLDYDLSEPEIRKRYPRLMDYLKGARRLGLLNRHLIRERRPWYKQERRAPAPFLCTYMGRGRRGVPPLRFIWNKSDAIATNTYLLLYPHSGLDRLLSDRPGLDAEMFALLQETERETIVDISRVHAGGLHKIEPRELLGVRLSSSPPWLMLALDSQLEIAASDSSVAEVKPDPTSH